MRPRYRILIISALAITANGGWFQYVSVAEQPKPVDPVEVQRQYLSDRERDREIERLRNVKTVPSTADSAKASKVLNEMLSDIQRKLLPETRELFDVMNSDALYELSTVSSKEEANTRVEKFNRYITFNKTNTPDNWSSVFRRKLEDAGVSQAEIPRWISEFSKGMNQGHDKRCTAMGYSNRKACDQAMADFESTALAWRDLFSLLRDDFGHWKFVAETNLPEFDSKAKNDELQKILARIPEE